MSLLIGEGALNTRGELIIGPEPLPVALRITVERLRGIAEPTWYGSFTLLEGQRHVLPLPGSYRLHIHGHDLQIVLRRPARSDTGTCFPFWGVGAPPRFTVVPTG